MLPPSRSFSDAANIVASAGLLLASTASGAGFDATDNVAVYWGQNSYGQASGSLTQQSLATYCANTNIDIIPLAFLLQITTGTGGQPVINLANAGNNCTLFTGTSLLDCPQIGEEIVTCQEQYGKTILLSIGGATYTESGFKSEEVAISAAQLVWDTFGPASAAESGTITSSPTPTAASNLTTMTGSENTTTTSKMMITGNTTTGTLAPDQTPTPSITTLDPTILKLTNDTTSELKTPGPTETTNSFYTQELITVSPSAFPTIPDIPQITTFSTQFGRPPPGRSGRPGRPGRPPFPIVNVGGPPQQKRQTTTTILRPFHDASIDGFDLDLESTVQNFIPFAQKLRELMDAETSKSYYLTAAPQCVYPDAAVGDILNSPDVVFDAVFVQFYNNVCGLPAFKSATDIGAFNFDVWNTWAKDNVASGGTTRKRASSANTKVFLGVPAGPSAAGSGYKDLAALTPIIEYCKTFSTFGGVMMWDASQAVANEGFLEGVKSVLVGGNGTATRTDSTVTNSTATTTSTALATRTLSSTSTLNTGPAATTTSPVSLQTGSVSITTVADTIAEETGTVAEPSIPPSAGKERRSARDFMMRRYRMENQEHWVS